MPFDVPFRVARWIDRATRARDHCWSWRPRRCWHCDGWTHWLEMNFEAPLHRGRCTAAKDREYWEAVRRPCPACGEHHMPGNYCHGD